MTVDGVKGQSAAGISLIYDTLLTPALDEVSTAARDLKRIKISAPAFLRRDDGRRSGPSMTHGREPKTPCLIEFIDGIPSGEVRLISGNPVRALGAAAGEAQPTK